MPPAVQEVDEIVDQGYKIVDQPCLAGHVRWRLLFHCCISHPSNKLQHILYKSTRYSEFHIANVLRH